MGNDRPRIRVIRDDDEKMIPWPGDPTWYRALFPPFYKPHVTHDCPTCGDSVTLYRSPLSARGALELAEVYRDYGTSWFTTKRGPQNSSGAPTYRISDLPRVAWWGLVERGKGAEGTQYRVTKLGVQWLRGEAPVPKYVVQVRSHPLWKEGQDWYVSDARKKKFDLDRFLAGEL